MIVYGKNTTKLIVNEKTNINCKPKINLQTIAAITTTIGIITMQTHMCKFQSYFLDKHYPVVALNFVTPVKEKHLTS